MDFSKFDGVFRMMKTMEKLNRLANPIQLPLLYSAGVAKILDHPAYNTNWANSVIDKIPNSLDFALKIAQPKYQIPLHFVDTINRLNIHKKSLYNVLDNYNRINKSIFSNNLIQSFDTTVFNITSKFIDDDNLDNVITLDKALKEIATIINNGSKSAANPNLIKKKLSLITKIVQTIESEVLKNDLVKLIGYIWLILSNFCAIHGYYLALNPDNTYLEKNLEYIKDELKEIKQNPKPFSDTLNGKILICKMDATIYKMANKTSKKVGHILKGQSVVLVSNKVKWMLISFENDKGEAVSGWVLKSDFFLEKSTKE